MSIVDVLCERLMDEKEHKIKGGIYNKLQVDFAFNSNHIEGSKLSHEQTRYIFETHTIGAEAMRVDDVIETVNHFRCFDYILDTKDSVLTEDYIKSLHTLLKVNTFSAQAKEAVVGDYKKYPNEVGSIQTSLPKDVSDDIKALLSVYNAKKDKSFDDILDFHAKYEKIHPFYDGNGRTGRLLMFKECLKNDIVPFIIEDKFKAEYYRGLYNWQTGGEKGYLRDTCLYMQDYMNECLKYFEINDDGFERAKCSTSDNEIEEQSDDGFDPADDE